MNCKFKSAGVGGSVLSILSNCLSNRTQRVCLDGASSRFHPVASGVPQGSVLGPILFILYTSDMFNVVVNRLISYADDTTLVYTINSVSEREVVAHSLSNDYYSISK